MKKRIFNNLILASAIRIFLMRSNYQSIISERVEVSTALNSWKREGVYLRNQGIDPYSGDVFHETPIGLAIFASLQMHLSNWALCVLFILTDLATALFLAATAKLYIQELIVKEKEERTHFVNDTNEKSQTSMGDISSTAVIYIPAAYLFNPYVVLNCVGFTTTVFTNFLYSAALYFMIRQWTVGSSLANALLTLQGLYPVNLMIPTIIYSSRGKNGHDVLWVIVKTILIYCIISIALLSISYYITGSWSFLRSTFGFILTVPDLRPNIGLYWYFFTEMFEHFRWLFVASFQINVGTLYVVPLALRLRRDPLLLAFSFLAITSIFKSYPCIGDVGFYMSLLPLWKHLFRYMQQGFVIGCFILFCTVFAPTVWHQWIYSRSANANFYFGVTLAFAIAQIFLLTDVLFTSIKREFVTRHGFGDEINGNKVKFLLE
ncbi:phosphatidylinositol glycan anchor biosynthesis class U protein isoform X2 [Orussus abietinus]|uniref:phosphatidylinositol glycan anchor biosynthesis class U protein isoform X2 n=1 Tax=Orussus abietinus TaxID=222816 RepID=UPI000626CA9B|nr:phosphatidylinositol glycan anchor biosynthesis class U protein isoform X2 [Orussus abietinus]